MCACACRRLENVYTVGGGIGQPLCLDLDSFTTGRDRGSIEGAGRAWEHHRTLMGTPVCLV